MILLILFMTFNPIFSNGLLPSIDTSIIGTPIEVKPVAVPPPAPAVPPLKPPAVSNPVLTQINAYRASVGLSQLTQSAELNASAQAHSSGNIYQTVWFK